MCGHYVLRPIHDKDVTLSWTSSSTDDAPRTSWRATVRGNVLMMGLVSLFTDASSEMVFPLLPLFLSGLVGPEMVAIYVGLLAGIPETTSSLLKIVSGRISDRAGKRKALVVFGYGVSTVARPLMALAGAGWHVVAMRFADRVGKGVRTSPRDALIGDSVGPAARGLAFSFHRAMDHAGAILGPVAAVAILYSMLGYGLWRGGEEAASLAEMDALRCLFAISLIPGLAAMVALISKVREIPPRKAPAADGAAQDGRRLPRKFYAFVGVVGIFALGNSSDLFIVFLGRKLFHMSLIHLIGLWVLLHVSKIVFSVPGGMLSDKLGRRPLIIAGWAVYALVYLGLAVTRQQWAFWALVAAYGLYYGLTEGAEKALVTDFVPSDRRATAFGIYHGAIGLAALPASLMFGVLLGLAGRGVAFGIGAALAAVAAALLVVLLSATKPSASAAAGD